MLFTDGPFVTSADLNVIDGEFTVVAAEAKICVDGTTNSIINESILSAGSEFVNSIQNFSGYLIGSGANSNSNAAVMNVMSGAINRPRALLNQITVTEPDPTRTSFVRWVKYYCLHDFYRMVFARRVKEDRFAVKLGMYDNEKRRFMKILRGNGFPVVLNPLPRPAALWQVGSGTWDETDVTSSGSGSQGAAVDYDVCITWVSQPGYVSASAQNGCESAGSNKVRTSVPTGNLITVGITNLNPPGLSLPVAMGLSQGVYSPQSATGWNVYAGVSGGTLFLQNSSPIPVRTKTYTFTGAPVTSGQPINAGQPAQFDFTMINVLGRG